MKSIDEKMNEIIEVAKDIAPGKIAHVEVKHSDNCKALKTRRMADCNCQPIIKKMEEC